MSELVSSRSRDAIRRVACHLTPGLRGGTNRTNRDFAGALIDPLTGRRRYLVETAKSYDDAKLLPKLQRQVDVDQHPKTAITVRQAITQCLDVAEHEEPPASGTTT